MTADHPQSEITQYYNRGREQARLAQTGGKLELVRTQEVILRYLPKPPAVVLDIGGGAGIYALWLARLGYEVHLVDLMPIHIEQATAAAQSQPEAPLASIRLGDARQLEFADNSADAVLLLGPLYHLTERGDRVRALEEVRRVLKPSGFLFAAVISRFAPLVDALVRGFLADPYFVELTERDLHDGQHRNPRNQPGYFSTAYFHHPDELQPEIEDAGLVFETALTLEGLGAVLPNTAEVWEDDDQRERLLHFLRLTENEPSLRGVGGHLLTVSRKT